MCLYFCHVSRNINETARQQHMICLICNQRIQKNQPSFLLWLTINFVFCISYFNTYYYFVLQNSTLESGEPSISSYIYLPVQHIVRVYNILQQILVFIDDASLSSTMHSKYLWGYIRVNSINQLFLKLLLTIYGPQNVVYKI